MTNTDEIKSKIDIVDFISRYLQLKKAGVSFKAVCPFHSEKTPSFFISPQRQSWRCFGCNQGGDIFKFLMLYEKIEFPEALQILAEKAGVELRREDPGLKSEKLRLMKICETTAGFFSKNLSENPAVLKYLKDRGLTNETIKEFELGFAPTAGNQLLRYLGSLKFSLLDISAAGLIIKSENGEYFDRFRSRVMFPIKNSTGRAIGFTGRIFGLSEKSIDVPKYHNSPETLVFQKGRIFYGLDKTQEEIRKTKSAVITEGQMDFLLSWQNGIKNVVATSGTALTEFHLKILQRFAETLYLAFDTDEAGEAATYDVLKLIKNFSQNAGGFFNGFNLKKVIFSEKDVADYFQKNPGKGDGLLQKSEPFFDFIFKRAEQFYKPDTTEGRKKFALFVLDKIRHVLSSLDQGFLLERLSSRVKVEKNVLISEMQRLPKEILVRQNEEAGILAQLDLPERRALISDSFLAACLDNKEGADLINKVIDFMPDNRKSLARAIAEFLQGGKEQELFKEEIDQLNLLWAFQKDMGFDIVQEIGKLERELKKEFYKKEIRMIQEEIKIKEEKKEEITEEIFQALQENLKEYNQLIKIAKK